MHTDCGMHCIWWANAANKLYRFTRKIQEKKNKKHIDDIFLSNNRTGCLYVDCWGGYILPSHSKFKCKFNNDNSFMFLLLRLLLRLRHCVCVCARARFSIDSSAAIIIKTGEKCRLNIITVVSRLHMCTLWWSHCKRAIIWTKWTAEKKNYPTQ